MTRRWLDPSVFTDEKLATATVAERHLFIAMIANQDDDGRLLAHPGYLRSITFPYDDFTNEQIKEMRDHLAQINPNVIIYQNGGNEYIQLKRHARYQRPRYYHPSRFPAPAGWPFEESNQQVTKEQPQSIQNATKQQPEKHQIVTLGEGEGEGKGLDLDLDLDKGEGKGLKRHSTASPATLTQIYNEFVDSFEKGWGEKTTGKLLAQMRDFSQELCAAGCPPSYVSEAFKEAASMNKLSLSYVKAILFDWLGIPRAPPG